MSPAIWPARACGRFTALMGGHTAEATGSHYAVYGDKPDVCLAEPGYQPELHQPPPRLSHSSLKHSEDGAGAFDAWKEACRKTEARRWYKAERGHNLLGDRAPPPPPPCQPRGAVPVLGAAQRRGETALCRPLPAGALTPPPSLASLPPPPPLLLLRRWPGRSAGRAQRGAWQERRSSGGPG